MQGKYGLSSHWVTFYREIDAIFGDDPDVRVDFKSGDGEDPVVRLYVTGPSKAEAIDELLPSKVDFGSVTVLVEVVPANGELSKADLFKRAFEGNPAFSYTATVTDAFSNPISYIVFRNRVVQFFNDDLGDVNGNESTLYEDIARHLFDASDGVFFCTDVPENIGKPVGERP